MLLSFWFSTALHLHIIVLFPLPSGCDFTKALLPLLLFLDNKINSLKSCIISMSWLYCLGWVRELHTSVVPSPPDCKPLEGRDPVPMHTCVLSTQPRARSLTGSQSGFGERMEGGEEGHRHCSPAHSAHSTCQARAHTQLSLGHNYVKRAISNLLNLIANSSINHLQL